ncbi:ZIP Zinc transporter [Planctomycetes bacterium Poly30]|uniref:ZIP Zinc transporter n=1 Tax=Saltatorellus ferox TaxID=2528018 RepID=A0A518ERH6_9BACT|nr:ZIP Zinc transporter [Planctomycetes bacterium Poly30]
MFEFFSILLVGLAGGLVPLFFKWGDRQHHIALAFSTGIFLGAVFLHLLPGVAAAATSEGEAGHAHGAVVAVAVSVEEQAAGMGDHAEEFRHYQASLPSVGAGQADAHAGHDHGTDTASVDPHAGHLHGAIGPWLWVLIGLLGVFFIEAVFIPGTTHGHGHGHNDKERHSAVGWAALVGLTVHALTAGVALAAVQSQSAIAGVMLLAILAHKGFESFSLAAVFSMTGSSRSRVLGMVVAFSFVTPLGLLAGSQISGLLGSGGISILTSLAAGTFLYVCLCELLPEVFHHREDGPWKIGLLLLGIVAMWYAHSYGGI